MELYRLFYSEQQEIHNYYQYAIYSTCNGEDVKCTEAEYISDGETNTTLEQYQSRFSDGIIIFEGLCKCKTYKCLSFKLQ